MHRGCVMVTSSYGYKELVIQDIRPIYTFIMMCKKFSRGKYDRAIINHFLPGLRVIIEKEE